LCEFGRQYAIYGVLTNPGSLALARAMASPAYWAWYLGLVLVLSFLPLYFPYGRLLSPRWRSFLWFAVPATVIFTAVNVFRSGGDETRGIPNPLGVEGSMMSGAFEVIVPVLWLVLGVSTVSLMLRFRRSGGQEHQQIKWVAYTVVLMISFTFSNQVLQLDLLPFLSEILFTFVLEVLWISIAIVLFRYRLYDIDLIINRTLVYGVLTLSLALIYFGGIVQATLRAVSGQETSLAVVASTLAIAALFNPLRRRIQEFIDRRFYRRKYDAARTLRAFSSKLREETHLNRLGGELVSV
jgi:hypothetical protein